MIRPTNSGVQHDLTMFDVGQGDCVLLRDHMHHALVIDCGAQSPARYSHVPHHIELLSSWKNQCGLVISHYHSDHYSLYRGFSSPPEFLSNIYLPDLPVSQPSGAALFEFLYAAVLVNYGHYRILPELFRDSGRNVLFRKKGDKIKEANLEFDVVWPDFRLITRRRQLIAAAGRIRNALDPILEKHELPLPEQLPEQSMGQFLYAIDEIRRREWPPREVEQMRGTLGRIERDFILLADHFSLVFKTVEPSRTGLLFLGDLTDSLLNRINVGSPGASYSCIKASHHGTRFGSALAGTVTDFLLVSRNSKESPRLKKIHHGYLEDMECKMILTTEFMHTCHIGRSGGLFGELFSWGVFSPLLV